MSRNGSFVGSIVAAAGHRKRVWAAQAVGNLVLGALFYGWLRIPDQSGWQFAATLMLGGVIAAGVLALQGGTLVYFRDAHSGEDARLRRGCRVALSHWLPMAFWTALALTLLWLVVQAWDYNAQFAGWLRHLLPGFLRRGVSVRFVDAHLDMVTWFCAWVLLPAVLLPLAAQVANDGWRGFVRRDVLRALATLRYWVLAVVLILAGGPLALWIARHASQDPSSTVQAASMAVRFVLAYLLKVTAWVLFCSLLGWLGRRPGPEETVEVREPVGVSPPARQARAAADPE